MSDSAGSSHVARVSGLRRLARHRVVAYAGTGLLSLSVDLGVLLLLREVIGAPVWVAGSGGYWTSVVVNYLVNRRVVFRDRVHTRLPVVRYGVLLAVNWASTLVLMQVAEVVGLGYLVGKVLSVGLLTVLNYVAYSRWVFADGR